MLKKGFTLIELLVVVAIIGILAGLVVGSVSGARKRAKDAKVKNDVAQLMRAAEVQLTENSSFTQNSTTEAAFTDTIVASFKDEAGTSVIKKTPIYPSQSANDTTNGYTWTTDAASASTKYLIRGKLSNANNFCASAGSTFEAASCGSPL